MMTSIVRAQKVREYCQAYTRRLLDVPGRCKVLSAR